MSKGLSRGWSLSRQKKQRKKKIKDRSQNDSNMARDIKHKKQSIKQDERPQNGVAKNDLTKNDITQNAITQNGIEQKDTESNSGARNDIASSDQKTNESEDLKKAVRVRKRGRFGQLVAKTGKTRILVYGKNSVRAVHAISKSFKVENIVNSSEGVEFSVQSKHCGKIIALLDNLCYSYKIVKIYGILPKSLLILSRVGVILGLAVAICAMSVYPSFITRVSVDYVGDTALNKNAIADLLSTYGISEGARTYNADIEGAKYGLLSLDGVTFASIERNGTHIRVTVKAVDDDILADISGSGVVAKKQAVVERIVVESGTAVKKHGDIVKPGDVLIDGYIEYGDEKIPVQASGYAYGRVYYNKSVFFPNTAMKKTYSRQKTVTKLAMFGKTPKAPKSPFEQYECRVSVKEFGFLLPFEIYSYTFFEVSVEEVENTMSEEQMQDEVYAQIIEEFSMECKVLDKIFKVERQDNGYIVDVTVETEERI